MIRRPPRSTLSSSSAASDVYKRQVSTQSTGNSQTHAMLASSLARHLPREVLDQSIQQLKAHQLATLAHTSRSLYALVKLSVRAICLRHSAVHLAEQHRNQPIAVAVLQSQMSVIKQELSTLRSLMRGPTSFLLESSIHRLRGLLGGHAQGAGMVVAAGAVDLLIELLQTGDAQGQGHAIYSLTQLAAGSASRSSAIAKAGAVTHLVNAVRAGDAHRKGSAAYALMQIALGSRHRGMVIAQSGAIPVLLQLLQHGDAFGKGAAAHALGHLPLGPEDKQTMKAALSDIAEQIAASCPRPVLRARRSVPVQHLGGEYASSAETSNGECDSMDTPGAPAAKRCRVHC
eukprot:TRINITY_DN2141_c0_g1_i1.p1 TRINITY_DN2141_c0_g1~~TRINITY_DN2141_c0_g1_i1.p1  ORF type:complete len:344 (-),score=64.27 TRINITY_DN2141_c0_g1_i1:301-1332(-)